MFLFNLLTASVSNLNWFLLILLFSDSIGEVASGAGLEFIDILNGILSIQQEKLSMQMN